MDMGLTPQIHSNDSDSDNEHDILLLAAASVCEKAEGGCLEDPIL